MLLVETTVHRQLITCLYDLQFYAVTGATACDLQEGIHTIGTQSS